VLLKVSPYRPLGDLSLLDEETNVLKGAQDRETRGRQISRASSKTEALHTAIITIERPRFESRESGKTVECSEHSKTNNNTIII